MNQGWTYREQVDRRSAGLTVLAYYAQRYRHSTPDEWQKRIAAGQILLDETPTDSKTRLRQGQWLTYHRPPWTEPEVPLTFEVLYEDDDLVVVAKPSGLPVLPGGGFLEHTLLWQLQQRYPQNSPIPIHRLGRGTSGLMLLARSPQARAALSQQLRDRHIHKVYRALVSGIVVPDSLTITQPIGKLPYPVLGYVYAATADGLPAYSECRVLQHHASTTLVEVTILTGRPHQIRIHMASVGHPLVGDPLYEVGGGVRSHFADEAEGRGQEAGGGDEGDKGDGEDGEDGGDGEASSSLPSLPSLPSPPSPPPHTPHPTPHSLTPHTPHPSKFPVPGDCGYFLHAVQLSFDHPVSRQRMTLTCPPPPELQTI